MGEDSGRVHETAIHIAAEQPDTNGGYGKESSALKYRIHESPPLQLTLLLAMQHLMICFGAALTLSIIIGDVLCADVSSPVRSQLFSTALCLSGLNTVAQSLWGSRLPVFQGPSFTFISPLLAVATDPTWTCAHEGGTNGIGQGPGNSTVVDTVVKVSAFGKLQQMSGSLMAASVVEVAIGALGLVGPLLRFVGPITVAPTITLIGLGLYKLPAQMSRPCLPMAIAMAVLVLVFSLYLQKVHISVGCGKNKTRLPIFQVLPVLLAMCLVWSVAAILTACGVFPDDPDNIAYLARTDARIAVVQSTPWLLITYPGQFGLPSFNVAAFVGFTAAVLSSVVESVGDYMAAARSCDVPPPPQHAVSRGLLLEGLGSVLSGAYGAGHATATYSGNVALLRLCRAASRSVLVVAGLALVVVSLLGKLAAFFSTVPDPVLAGVAMIVIGVLVGLGVSILRVADLQSTRNIIIIGVSLFIGMMVPEWVTTYPETVDTGHSQVNQMIRVILGTPMIVGGLLACFLDNTVSGTWEERGLHEWASLKPSTLADQSTEADAATSRRLQLLQETYGWRWYSHLSRKYKFLSIVPFLPSRSTRLADC